MFMQTYILTRIVKLQYGKTGFEKETSSRSSSIGPLSGSNRILQPPRCTHISPLLIRSEIRPVHKTFWITADFGTLWQLCYYNKNSLMCAPFLNTIVNKSIRGRVKLNGQLVDPRQNGVKSKTNIHFTTIRSLFQLDSHTPTTTTTTTNPQIFSVCSFPIFLLSLSVNVCVTLCIRFGQSEQTLGTKLVCARTRQCHGILFSAYLEPIGNTITIWCDWPYWERERMSSSRICNDWRMSFYV